MSNFAQKTIQLNTFHLLTKDTPHMRTDLRHYSRWKKGVLIIPTLASEYMDPENRPVFERIVRQLRCWMQ
jgi:glucosyl-3-phosphoglycerate synthase